MPSQPQVNQVVVVLLLLYSTWDVLTDLASVGQLLVRGSDQQPRLDVQLYRQCVAAASNTEYCLYLRRPSQPPLENIWMLCLPFLCHCLLYCCLWLKKTKFWTNCQDDDVDEENSISGLVVKVHLTNFFLFICHFVILGHCKSL